MTYHCFHLDLPAGRFELVSAWLQLLPVEGILETPEGLDVYAPEEESTEGLPEAIRELSGDLDFTFTYERVAGINWNARWESDFQPVRIGTFAGVRAAFHPPMTEVSHDLVIQPKMAFGTGHHATTHLMMETMERLDWKAKTVFDFGCGTGILGILAAKLGAIKVDAVDIEAVAVENTIENAAVNGVGDRLSVWEGGLEAVNGNKYAIILANINRNVILDSLAALYDRLHPGGDLLISGILEGDFDLVSAEASPRQFKLLDRRRRDGWLVLHYTR
jgi:ribosomal protein L11 methyltransferase